MTQGSEERRPEGREHEPAPEEQRRPQEELERSAESSGGDAAGVASVDEREALARGEEPFFDQDEEDA